MIFTGMFTLVLTMEEVCKDDLNQNSQAVKKKSTALKNAKVKKDVKSKVAVKKWL